jgi:LysR family transcriptional regulator of gallate degradation
LGNRKGQVILGCLPLTRARLVPDAIRALISKYPDINVRVVDGIFPALFAMLMYGEMDILAGTLRDALPEGTNANFSCTTEYPSWCGRNIRSHERGS